MLRASGAPDLRGEAPAAGMFDVSWVDIDDPERAHTPATTDTLGVFSQGKAKGATTFARLEGCTYVDGYIYFSSTSGGATGHGEIWRYDPRNETIALIFTSPSFYSTAPTTLSPVRTGRSSCVRTAIPCPNSYMG
jgi:uncharacterized repeat protein (TIGR03803 family)